MDYYVIPKGNQPLMSLLLEANSPGAKALRDMGAGSHIYSGLPGFLLGNIFLTADPASLNVLEVIGTGDTEFLVEMPVTKISVPRKGEMVFYDEDEKVTLYLTNKPSFHLEVGYVQTPQSLNGHKPSPWK
jgi:hypothetical protein